MMDLVTDMRRKTLVISYLDLKRRDRWIYGSLEDGQQEWLKMGEAIMITDHQVDAALLIQ